MSWRRLMPIYYKSVQIRNPDRARLPDNARFDLPQVAPGSSSRFNKRRYRTSLATRIIPETVRCISAGDSETLSGATRLLARKVGSGRMYNLLHNCIFYRSHNLHH
jgi:hypothetical protein